MTANEWYAALVAAVGVEFAYLFSKHKLDDLKMRTVTITVEREVAHGRPVRLRGVTVILTYAEDDIHPYGIRRPEQIPLVTNEEGQAQARVRKGVPLLAEVMNGNLRYELENSEPGHWHTIRLFAADDDHLNILVRFAQELDKLGDVKRPLLPDRRRRRTSTRTAASQDPQHERTTHPFEAMAGDPVEASNRAAPTASINESDPVPDPGTYQGMGI